MKHHLFLLPILFFTVGSRPTYEPWIEEILEKVTPVPEIVHNAWNMLNVQSHKTSEEKAILACSIIFCHFEDRNGCLGQCRNFAKQWNPANALSKTSVYTMKNNENDCRTDCRSRLMNGIESDKICASLCATQFSYPDTEGYAKELTVLQNSSLTGKPLEWL